MKSSWNPYVFRRGNDVTETWEAFFRARKKAHHDTKLLYVCGAGFDPRSVFTLRQFRSSLDQANYKFADAHLIIVDFQGYTLGPKLASLTSSNRQFLSDIFSEFGTSSNIIVKTKTNSDAEEVSTSASIREACRDIIAKVPGYTDVILDASSLPKIGYISIMLSILDKIQDTSDLSKQRDGSMINFQVLVAEDPNLDSNIQATDPSSELVLIPGYASALQTESLENWATVWFPILGEGKLSLFEKVFVEKIPQDAEICPVIPHPSKNLRRGDQLLVEYKKPLFDTRETPLLNVLYAHEANPFEAYRQILEAMARYKHSFSLMEGCKLLVTPLASKLLTLGSALACFEMRILCRDTNCRISIPCSEPKRYSIGVEHLTNSTPELTLMWLTGDPYL